MWWATIGKWCYFINNPSDSWRQANDAISNMESIRESLRSYCVVQLKKTWGNGSVANETLYKVISNDKDEIISQLSIYKPHYVVACGNGDQLSSMFGKNKNDRIDLNSGVGYWEIKLIRNSCFLIDYCHPSVRCGTKIKGLVAKCLAEAIHELDNNY